MLGRRRCFSTYLHMFSPLLSLSGWKGWKAGTRSGMGASGSFPTFVTYTLNLTFYPSFKYVLAMFENKGLDYNIKTPIFKTLTLGTSFPDLNSMSKENDHGK